MTGVVSRKLGSYRVLLLMLMTFDHGAMRYLAGDMSLYVGDSNDVYRHNLR